MYRAVLVTLVLLGLTGFFSRAEAKLIPYRKLTPDQRLALQASEQRLATYDRALVALESARRHGKISRTEFHYEEHDLVAFISAESRFQNDILIDDQPFPPENVREVMENIVKYGVIYPAMVIGYLALRVLPSVTP
jgi:hypothetical protein